MASLFSTQAIATQTPTVSAKAELLLQRLLSNTRTQGTANAYKLANLFSFDVICSLALDKEFPPASGDECLGLVKAMDGSTPFIVIVCRQQKRSG